MSEPLVTVNLKGFDELQRKLEELKGPKAAKAMRAGLKAMQAPVLAEIQHEAPRESGFLAEHFDTKYKTKDGGMAGAAYVGPQGKMYYPDRGTEMRGKGGQRLVATGKHGTAGAQIPVVSVARFHEFGTKDMAANPFMSRSLHAKGQAAIDALAVALKKALGLE